jgi:predicted negative regulator of RcsB-dependent stress response
VDTTLLQARRMGAPRAIALCQCFSGALEYQAGNWDTAEQALKESIELYQELGAASGEALAWQRLGVLQTARGELEPALHSFQEGIYVAERAVMRAHCLGRLYASLTRNRLLAEDLPAAVHYLSLGLEMSQRHGNCATCTALLLPAATSVSLARRDIQKAEEYCRDLEAAAQEYGSRIWVAMAKQARGELLASTQEPEEALENYEQAYQAYREAGHDYEAARCLEAMVAIYTNRNAPKDRQQAAEAQAQASILLNQMSST